MEKEIISIYEKSLDNINTEDIIIINQTIKDLSNGKIKVAQKINNLWIVNEWIKKAILLYFKVNKNYAINNAPNNAYWFDKIPNKFESWAETDFEHSQIRCTPLSYVRYGAYIAPKVVIMPSFVNIGAYIDSNTMIDSWVTIGSCSQIGKNCHISADVCIGGVLEPIQSRPVIIEDNCFIGSGCKILEGTIIENNCVIAAGTTISASTKIVNRDSGEITYGKIREGSVVVPGSINTKNNLSINCAIIIKKIDSNTKNKTSINTILRD